MLKLPSFPINAKVKGIELQQIEMVSHRYKFTSECHNQTTPSLEQRYPGSGIVFNTLSGQANRILFFKVIFKVLDQQVQQIDCMILCYGTRGSRQQINRKSIQEEYIIWFFVAGA